MPVNHVFKQRCEEEWLCPELDLNGSSTNGWSIIRGYNETDCEWRFATLKEIEEYDRLGKPFNINKLAGEEPVIFYGLI